jgi:hypothetical protein
MKFIISVFFVILLSFLIPNNAFANNLITANSTTTSNGITLYTKWSGDLLLTGCETLRLSPFIDYSNNTYTNSLFFNSGVIQIIENGKVSQTFSLNGVNDWFGISFNLCSNRSTFENGMISALGQNRNLNIRVNIILQEKYYSFKDKAWLTKRNISRTLNTSLVYVVKAPQQTTNPTPQQTTNPTPQQTTNPTPQQTTNPTPQQTSNPTPEIVIQNRVIQSEWGVPMELVNTSVKGKMITIPTGESRLALYELKELYDYNEQQYRSLKNSLISKSKKSKQTECGNYEILGNVFGDKLVNEDCFVYQPVALNLITGQVSERTLYIDSSVTIPGTTRIQVTFTKFGTKNQKTISSKNYKIVLGDVGANFTSIINLPEYVGESGNLQGIIRLKITNNSIKGKKSITKRLN